MLGHQKHVHKCSRNVNPRVDIWREEVVRREVGVGQQGHGKIANGDLCKWNILMELALN